MYADKEMPEMPGTREPLYMDEPSIVTEARKRRDALINEPRIYADLMKGGGGQYILTCMGTRWDLRHYGIVLQEGKLVRFCDDDVLFEGHVHFDQANNYWVAVVDENCFHYVTDAKSDVAKP